MRSETEPDPYSTPKLPLFSMTSLPHISEPSGMLTPPLQTSASVPFQWEEQPGKPRPCTDLIIHPNITRPERSLDLPPRLAMLESLSKTACSPTTVLDGPGDLGGKSLFLSASCRFSKEKRRRIVGFGYRQMQRQRSFDSSSCSGGWSPNDDMMLLGGKKNDYYGGKSLFGSFRLKGGNNNKSKVNDDDKRNFVISLDTNHSIDSGCFEDKKMKKLKRNSSLAKITRSHFWVSIYEGFKHVVPWKKKPKKESVDSL